QPPAHRVAVATAGPDDDPVALAVEVHQCLLGPRHRVADPPTVPASVLGQRPVQVDGDRERLGGGQGRHVDHYRVDPGGAVQQVGSSTMVAVIDQQAVAVPYQPERLFAAAPPVLGHLARV